MNTPIVLISMRVTEETSYVERRSALADDYVRWFESDGRLVVPVPSITGDVGPYLDLPNVRVVVLTGGNNVDPTRYGSAETVPQVYPERDRVEFSMIAGAVKRGIPVFGVCRGLHTINVYYGGALTTTVEGHVARDHDLVSEHELLRDARCNSYHNQAVRGEDLSPKLRALAHSPDGLVEALYHPTEPVFAVQWHPERQDRTYDRSLLAAFLAGDFQR